MNDEDQKRLLRLSARWDVPRGPCDDVEEEIEMKAEIDRLGPGSAKDLLAIVLEQAKMGFEHQGVLEIFFDTYARAHPQAAREVLLEALGEDGPPLVIAFFQNCGAPGVAQRILETVRFDPTNEALVEALIDTFQRLRDPAGLNWLRSIDHTALSEAMKQRLDETLAWFAMRRD